MLTVEDQTVRDCLELMDEVRPLGLKHVGFKDIGVGRPVLAELTRRIREAGAVSYLEVVSTTPETVLASTRAALELGIDRLLGGIDAPAMLETLKGSAIRCYPFAGKPIGHPTKLDGSGADIAADCRRLEALGAAGVDLLAYRATQADPLDLVRAARRVLAGELIVAGSIDSPERVKALAAAGADAFTVGTAAIRRRFSALAPDLVGQLQAILAACG